MAKPNVKSIAPDIETVSPLPVEAVDTGPDDAAARAAAEIMSNLPASYETMREKARYYGGIKSAGDDSLAMLGIDMCANAKLIDPRSKSEREKAKLADTTDEVEQLFSDYTNARKNKAIHERKDVANKSSQLRNFVKLGRLDNIDGPALLDDAKSAYKTSLELVTDKKERAKYNDAFTTYLEVAKAQLDTDQLKVGILDETQISKCFFKKPSKVKPSVARQWAKIAKMAKALTDGTFKDVEGNVIEDKSTEGLDLSTSIAAYSADLDQLAKLQALDDEKARINFEREAREAARVAAE